MRSKPVILFISLIVITLLLFCFDLSVGTVNIPLDEVWAALTGGDCSQATAKIILDIRLIKALVALLAGA
ncbi:MAG: iron chelate uptake ABC transporter family permease subunit, partial [Prevotella sp.]|nr:iron chelate uptake ABC transporter family permease subunit [Prevotella sp.]